MPVLMSKNESGQWEQVGVNVIASGGGGSITVDNALSETSLNPVQNKVITASLKEKLSLSGGTMTGPLDMAGQEIKNILDAVSKNQPVSLQQLEAAIATLGTVFDLKGSKPTASDLPPDGNKKGDVWYVEDESVGYIWITKNGVESWEPFGPAIDLSGYLKKTDVDAELSDISENPVQNKTVNTALKLKADKTELAEKADKSYVDQTFANAFTKTLSGPVVAVDDVSPVEHQVGCKVERINLLSQPYVTVGTVERGGITCKILPDFTIVLNGTNTSPDRVDFYLANQFKIPAGKYVLSGGAKGGNSDTGYFLWFSFLNLDGSIGWLKDDGSYKYPEYTLKGMQYVVISVMPGGICKNVIMKPMISKVPVPYTPYVPDLSAVTVSRQRADGTDVKTYTPAPDGTVSGMTSLSPDMTILTDNPGVTIEATYNRDGNKVVQELMDKIAALESAKTEI